MKTVTQNSSFMNDLELLRTMIVSSGLFPRSLTGACSVAGILVQAVCELYKIDSELIMNSKHSFVLSKDENGINYIIDLTATQISTTRFAPICIIPLNDALDLSSQTLKGLGFYSLVDNDKNKVIRGSLDHVIQPINETKGEAASLGRIFNMLSIVVKNTSITKLVSINNREYEKISHAASYIANFLKTRENFLKSVS